MVEADWLGVGVEVEVDGRRSRSNGGAGQRDEGGDSEWREPERAPWSLC